MRKLVWLLVFATACRAGGVENGRYMFRAALFPWIPDAAGDGFQAMRTRMETEFEALHPGIDLQLRFFPGDDGHYDIDSLTAWFTEPPERSGGGYHLVEVDAVLLGLLADEGLVQAWDSLPRPDTDWMPYSLSAIDVNGARYGVPHWLCEYFVISRDTAVLAAATIGQLAQALERAPQTLDLAGRLAGSWELPSLYLDAWSDTYGPDSVQKAVSPTLDSAAVRSLRTIAALCQYLGTRPCLDGGVFDDYPDSAAIYFALGVADATWGYSERLNVILNEAPDDSTVWLKAAPFGQGNAPLGFTDVYAKRADCDTECQAAALAFTAYMTLPSTFQWIAMSEDAGPTAVPRYLIPSTLSAFGTDSLSQNVRYTIIGETALQTAAFPNVGLPAAKDTMRAELDALLAALARSRRP